MIQISIDGTPHDVAPGDRLVDAINRAGVSLSQVCFAQAHLFAASNQREDFVASHVPGGENHVMASNEIHTRTRLRNQIASFINYPHARRRNPMAASSR
jgi:hypothetical protein